MLIKKLLILFCMALGPVVFGQTCPNLTAPLNGSTNVPVDTSISWNFVEGVTGYIVSIGTTPGDTDIINQTQVGSATTFTPPLGLPDNTQIYVTITLFFFDQPNITCTSESFRTEDVTTVPVCTNLNNPINGATNVNGSTNLAWNYAAGATSYDLRIGTSSGSADIFDQNVGNVLSYNPAGDFSAGTQIFVTVIPINDNGPATACPEESFTTGAMATLPSCTTMVSPANGAINVPLTPLLEWTNVPDATGYRVTIGNSPFTSEIVDNVIFFTNSTFVINFEPNRTFFITIVPFNAAGDAIGCTQESFSTILGCGPYFDSATGELISLNPEINFPDVISVCGTDESTTVTSTDSADGFYWYKIDSFGNETLISSSSQVTFTESGDYRYEAYNTITQSGNSIECPTSKNFRVEISEVAIINSVDISQNLGDLSVVINVQGIGDYEFAVNNSDGPYQESNVFNAVPAGLVTVFVRDKNGCGITEKTVEQDLTVEGFPKFFTPNGDGVNDFWQFIPPLNTTNTNLNTIFIFDRYGSLLAQIDPSSLGWNGDFNGRPVPASDYWFRAITKDSKELKGHFALKR
ncbi:MAG: T9SS type B sorting domain-containing protein [Maribacter sp.]|nr:T9SS type B sorting domain-containing protein [Maribacter sp.]